MWEWVNKIGMHWPATFANMIADYFNDQFLFGTLMRFGGWGGMAANGLTFVAKQAAYETSYFQSKEGWGFGWITGMFSSVASEANTTTTTNSVTGKG